MVGLGHAAVPRQPGLGQLLPVLGGGEPEEALEGMQIRHLAHLAHVALQVGADVGARPEIATLGVQRRDRIAAGADGPGQVRRRKLGAAERQQLQDRDAPGEGFAELLHQRELLRAREDPAAEPVGRRIDA